MKIIDYMTNTVMNMKKPARVIIKIIVGFVLLFVVTSVLTMAVFGGMILIDLFMKLLTMYIQALTGAAYEAGKAAGSDVIPNMMLMF